MSNNPFLNTNVDEIFNHVFLEELQNKITIEEKGDLLKKQQLYEYKYENIYQKYLINIKNERIEFIC